MGCQVSSSSEVSKGLITQDTSGYEKNSCTFSFDQGLPVLDHQNQPQYTTVSFFKTFDLGPLKAVLGASAHEMVNSMERTGVDIFAVPQPSRGCHNFLSLPNPPLSLEGFFRQIDRSIGGGALLGLFLSERRASGYGVNSPVIMIRTDADRWTLAHEFIHSLFSSYRLQFEKFDDQVFVDQWTKIYSESQSQFQAMNVEKLLMDPAAAETLANQWLIYSRSAMIYFKLFPLEEMTVESTLQDLYHQYQWSGVTDFDLQNSSSYIEVNFRFARNMIKETALIGQKLIRTLPQGVRHKNYPLLSQKIQELASLLSEAQKLRDQHVPLPLSKAPLLKYSGFY